MQGERTENIADAWRFDGLGGLVKGMPVDLVVIVEGPTDEVVLSAVFKRTEELKIRSNISFCFQRMQNAVCTKGPEIAAQEKGEFQRVILLWDHADSMYANQKPERAQGIVQKRLNDLTLKQCSKALAIDPELEIWLWQDISAIGRVLGVKQQCIHQWLKEWRNDTVIRQQQGDRELRDLFQQRGVDLQRNNVQVLVEKMPKEALEWVCKRADERADAYLLGKIASEADLKRWEANCQSLRWLCRPLRKWFP